MKKLLSILLLFTLILGLFSCTKDPVDSDQDENDTSNNETSTVRIGYFAGTTGLGMAKLLADGDSKYEFKQYDGPTFITAALATGEIDIAALPTNAVPNFYKQSNGLVQMIAINTLGVLHICTNGTTVNTLAGLEGKTIYVPEQAPKLVLEYILAQAGISATLKMEHNLDTLPAQIAQGLVDIALLPEPKVTVAQNQSKQIENSDFKVAIDLTTEWDKVCNTSLVQGCLVARKEFIDSNPKAMGSFLSAYEESINYVLNKDNLDAVANTIATAKILPNAAIAKIAIPRSNITYMDGEEMEAAAEGFFAALGITSPGSDLYYLPES